MAIEEKESTVRKFEIFPGKEERPCGAREPIPDAKPEERVKKRQLRA